MRRRAVLSSALGAQQIAGWASLAEMAHADPLLTAGHIEASQPTGMAGTDGPRLQEAVRDAAATGKELRLGIGTYVQDRTLLITRQLSLQGAGPLRSVLMHAGAGDAVKVNPPADRTSNRFYSLHGFSISSSRPGQGEYGLHVELAPGAFLANFHFEGLHIGAFPRGGLRLNNDHDNGDGFFTGTVTRCWITNGIEGTNLGDSIVIRENVITGAGPVVGIRLTGKPGAHQVIISENNITTIAYPFSSGRPTSGRRRAGG